MALIGFMSEYVHTNNEGWANSCLMGGQGLGRKSYLELIDWPISIFTQEALGVLHVLSSSSIVQ